MRIEDLEVFADVARHHSINIAAEKHFMTSQNVSKIIKNMEKDLNVVLFNRSTKGSELTAEGEQFYINILKVLDEYENALNSIHTVDSLKKFQEIEKMKLKVLCSQGAINYALINTRKEMAQEYNLYLDLNIIEYFNPERIREYITLEKYDLVACSVQTKDLGLLMKICADYVPMHIVHDEYVLLVSQNHPLANRSMISVEEFKNLNLLLPKDNYVYREFADTELRCAMIMNSLDMIIEQIEQSDEFCTLVCKSMTTVNKISNKKDTLRTIALDKKVFVIYILFVSNMMSDNEIIQEFCKRTVEKLYSVEKI